MRLNDSFPNYGQQARHICYERNHALTLKIMPWRTAGLGLITALLYLRQLKQQTAPAPLARG